MRNGKNYRKDLITVPSCAEHNLSNSLDDEYLLFVLTGNFHSNSVALDQWMTKIKRALKHSPAKRHIYKDSRPLVYRGVETGGFVIDGPRLWRELEKISRGIYFSHFGSQWLHDIYFALPFTFGLNDQAKQYDLSVAKGVELARRTLVGKEMFGSNPDIFYYQIETSSDTPGFMLRMMFYGGVEVISMSYQKPNVSETDVA